MNKKRKLIDGSEVEELNEPICIIIYTLSPEKWRIQDMETGQFYIGDTNPHPVYGKELKSLVQNAKIGQWKKI